jgi:nicotinate-nucleotide adenylyltransferase
MVAQSALEELDLHRFYFIPAARSPFKPDLNPAPAESRLQLLRLALAGMTACEVDEQEVRRGGTSYTVDTVRRYAAAHPAAALHLVVGADHVPSLPAWRNAEELATLVTVTVVPRPDSREGPLPSPFKGAWLKGCPLAVSSSEIRNRIGRGLPVELFTGPVVAEALRKNRLYL